MRRVEYSSSNTCAACSQILMRPWTSQGKLTPSMRAVVRNAGLRPVLADCYCDDFMHSDPEWIARTLLRQVKSGSIIIIHMPERGHWEHTLEALRLLLQGLRERQLLPVTLSQLAALAGIE